MIDVNCNYCLAGTLEYYCLAGTLEYEEIDDVLCSLFTLAEYLGIGWVLSLEEI